MQIHKIKWDRKSKSAIKQILEKKEIRTNPNENRNLDRCISYEYRKREGTN